MIATRPATELTWTRDPDGTYTAVGAVVDGGDRRYWRIRKEARRWHIHSVLSAYPFNNGEATYHGDTHTLGQAKDFTARADAFLAES